MSTENIHIESIAPVRVDLAGGTVDIWPLYLLLDSPKTINFGINLFATTTIDAYPSPTPQVKLESIDQKKSQTFSWSEILETKTQTIPELDFPTRLLRYFAKLHPNPQSLHLHLKTEAKSPSGAGLGGSPPRLWGTLADHVVAVFVARITPTPVGNAPTVRLAAR